MVRRRTTQTRDQTSNDQQTTDTAATAAIAGPDTGNAEASAPAPAPARRGRRPRTDSNGNAGGDADEAATGAPVAGTAPAPPAATAAIEEPAVTSDVEPPQQQRRRRRRTIDTAAEARLLIAAVLRQRGAAGASQDELQQVVSWGRSTRLEGQQLQRGAGQKGSGRGRRPSEEALARAQRSELNTLLLERVLLGTLGVDVQPGQLVFRRQELDGRITKG